MSDNLRLNGSDLQPIPSRLTNMPTYEYVCNACQHHWELFQSMSENPVKKCPECGKNKAERQIGTGGGIIFKGSGFYLTDYRSESYKSGAAADKPATESKSESKGEAKSESSSSPAKSSDE